MHLPRDTHCNMLHYICDDIPLVEQLYSRVLSFVKSLQISTNSITGLCYKLVMDGSQSAVSNSISVISKHYHIDRANVYTIRTRDYEQCLRANDTHAIHASVVRDLLYMQHDIKYGRPAPLDTEQINFMLSNLCTQ